MQIEKSTVLITGANRGIGLAFAKAFMARGAIKVYAGSRDPSKINLAGVTPIQLDVNSADDVQAAAKLAKDVTIVVNNAGIAGPLSIIGMMMITLLLLGCTEDPRGDIVDGSVDTPVRIDGGNTEVDAGVDTPAILPEFRHARDA